MSGFTLLSGKGVTHTFSGPQGPSLRYYDDITIRFRTDGTVEMSGFQLMVLDSGEETVYISILINHNLIQK